MKIAVLAVVPALILADTIIALARGWRSDSRLDGAVLAFAAVWLLVLGFTVASVRGRSYINRIAGKLVLSLGSFLVAWMVAEVVTTTTAKSWMEVPFHLHYPKLSKVFRPSPGLMPGIEGESSFTTNVRGVRGPELPPRKAAYRILCVGGSTTMCTYLDDTETWPHLLMQTMNDRKTGQQCWVGNIGLSGYAAPHHLRFVQESELMEELDCLIFLIGVNDLTRTLIQNNDLEPKSLAETSPPRWRSSNVLELARRVWKWRAETRADWIEDEAEDSYLRRRSRRQAGALSDELPNLQSALDEYAERLREMIAVCNSHRVRPVFVTQPVLWHKSLDESARSLLWLGWLKDGRYLTAARLADGMQQFNDRLKAVCTDANCLCIDLTPMNGQLEFFYDDCHLNEAGAREVTRRIVERLTTSDDVAW